MKKAICLLTALYLSPLSWSQQPPCQAHYDTAQNYNWSMNLDPESQALILQVLYYASQWLESNNQQQFQWQPEYQSAEQPYFESDSQPYLEPAQQVPAWQGLERGGPPNDGREYSNTGAYGFRRSPRR